jgi:hypothetical protein
MLLFTNKNRTSTLRPGNQALLASSTTIEEYLIAKVRKKNEIRWILPLFLQKSSKNLEFSEIMSIFAPSELCFGYAAECGE